MVMEVLANTIWEEKAIKSTKLKPKLYLPVYGMVVHMENLQELIKKNPPVISYYDCHYLDFFSIAVIKIHKKGKGLF